MKFHTYALNLSTRHNDGNNIETIGFVQCRCDLFQNDLLNTIVFNELMIDFTIIHIMPREMNINRLAVYIIAKL